MGKTLDYQSVERWMSLAVWASEVYVNWPDYVSADTTATEGQVTDLSTDEGARLFFSTIAVEALNRGFSLRAGDRAWAVDRLLKAIAPGNDDLLKAYYRIDKESWLTPPGAKPNKKRSNN